MFRCKTGPMLALVIGTAAVVKRCDNSKVQKSLLR